MNKIDVIERNEDCEIWNSFDRDCATGQASQERLHDIADVVEFCKLHGFPADIVGRWVWIRFPEKPDVETRDMLKAAGFRWVNIRKQWAHNCGYPTRRGPGNPRYKYGSIPVSEISQDDLRVLKGVPA